MKKFYALFNLLLFLLLNINGVLAQITWTQKANFPGSGRYAAICFQINDKAYVGTGYNGSTLLNDFWEYDTLTNAWTQKADFGGAARFSAAEFVINDTAYVGLGSAGYPSYVWTTDFWMYNPGTNVWTQKNNFPGPGRYDAARFSIGGKGYVGTGWSGSLYNDFWEYDPVADSWTQVADFPSTPRQSTAYFAYGGNGYVGCGANGGAFYNDMYEYDLLTDSWTQKNNYGGHIRNNTSQFIVGNDVYVGLGYDPSEGYKNDFWKYDPSTDTWTQADSFPGLPRFHAAAFVIGCKAYLAAGYTSTGIYENDFWQYNLCSTLPSASFQSSDRIFCAYSCVNFTNQSSNSTLWQWSFPGAMPDTSTQQNPQGICYFNAGTYGVTLIASDSSASDTLTYNKYITVYPAPVVPSIYRRGDTLYCTTQPTYARYQWFYNDSTIAGANDTFFVATQTGNYNVEVKDENGCSIAFGINIILGVNELDANSYFSLYPNPVNEELVVSMRTTFNDGDIEVSDIVGRKLFQQTFKSAIDNNLTIDFRNFASGIYFVSVTSDGERITRKIIKESVLR